MSTPLKLLPPQNGADHNWRLCFLLVMLFLCNETFQVGSAGVWRGKSSHKMNITLSKSTLLTSAPTRPYDYDEKQWLSTFCVDFPHELQRCLKRCFTHGQLWQKPDISWHCNSGYTRNEFQNLSRSKYMDDHRHFDIHRYSDIFVVQVGYCQCERPLEQESSNMWFWTGNLQPISRLGAIVSRIAD